jgi:hypothetical protein
MVLRMVQDVTPFSKDATPQLMLMLIVPQPLAISFNCN